MPRYHQLLDAQKGRCAVASVAIQAGSCILRTSAICAVPFSSCGWCFTTQVPLSRCTGCRKVCYCSRTCQQYDWSQHRRECSAWRSIPYTSTLPTVLIVSRLAAKLFLGSEANEEEKNQVLKLRHHLDDHSKAKLQQFKEMTQLVLLLLAQYKVDGKQPITSFNKLQNDLETEILKLFGLVNCNAFSLANDVTNEALGIGIYPDGALFNHDCDPNCIVSFKGREMLVHVVKDVGVGQELTVSYIELLQSTKARRSELRESYFFDCECLRCQAGRKEEVEDDWYLNGLVCSSKKGNTCGGVVVVEKAKDGSVSSATCKMCRTERDRKEIERLERQLKELETHKNFASEQDKWQLYQQKWEIVTLQLRLHPQNSRVAVMARTIGNFLFGAKSPGLQRLALPFFLAELRAVEWLLPNTKLPSRGLLHFQIGKLLIEETKTPLRFLSPANRAKQIESAVNHLQQSLSVLTSAYGSDSVAVQSAQLVLDEVQRTADQLL
ncbi:unnamed protein product [Peronospora farinosa]|uniref:Uncharacterized protein n=1 Tax=Peronospora farinosa TaxID=134698 RepID=A0AAV0UV39_9STRA|nr:unnamed protein product [Peronospora farinosa]CAI5739848.1 unnamed protein product [Peronospora farinosa]